MSDNSRVTIPTFSGKDKDFGVFWPRFKAYAVMKRFNDVLNENNDLPTDPTTLSSNADAKQK